MSQNESIVINYPGFWTKTSLIQLGYGVWVNLSFIAIGLAFGFSAVAVPQLLLPESRIKVSVADASWIASVLTLVSPIGCVFSGYLMDKLGRRIMLSFSQLPVCLGWLYTGYSGSARDIIIGRIITGFGIGMVTSAPRVFMTEISLPNMRGVVATIPNIAISIGITVQAGLGARYNWTTLCFISSAYALFLFFFNFGLPETPYFLLQRECTDDAKDSLKKFRSKSHDIEKEMVYLIEYKRQNDLHRLSFKEQMLVVFMKSTCKSFWMILIYLAITQFSGVTIIAMWTVDIIQKSNSSIDANSGNVILGITRLIGGIVTAVLIFKIRRRPMALVSGAGVGIMCLTVTLLINNVKAPTPFPLLCYVAYILFATLGHYNLPILIMYELYPLQVRGLMGGISLCCLNIFIFFAIKSYPYLRDDIGFANTILAFGLSSLIGCIFIYFFVPETKGLTLEQTESYYRNKG